MSIYGNIEDFRMGIKNEVLNVIALNKGDQIIICKKEEKTNNKVFLFAKKAFGSDFAFSEYGNKLMYEYVNNNGRFIKEREETNHIAKLEFIDNIPGTDLKFWQELYNQKEFCLWDPKNGPYKYYTEKRKIDSINMREKRVLWILRVYEIPFSLKLDTDYNEYQNTALLHNEQLRIKISEGFYKNEFAPVLSDSEFRKRRENILNIIEKYR